VRGVARRPETTLTSTGSTRFRVQVLHRRADARNLLKRRQLDSDPHRRGRHEPLVDIKNRKVSKRMM
jgi:hypothetical protein